MNEAPAQHGVLHHSFAVIDHSKAVMQCRANLRPSRLAPEAHANRRLASCPTPYTLHLRCEGAKYV